MVARIVEVAVTADLVDTATGGLNVPGYGHIPPFIYQRTDTGVLAFGNLPSRHTLMFTVEWTADGIDETAPFTLDEFRESVRRVLGADLPLQPPAYRLTRTTGVNTRVADRFSSDRVLLVGDAAHVHFVLGGPGLNLGLQDAVNVGWKLAASIRGWAPRRLLDTYNAERWPVAQRVAIHTQAQLALLAPGAEVTALRELFTELLGDVHTVAHIANLMAGADVYYDMGVADAARRPLGPRPGPRHRPRHAATGGADEDRPATHARSHRRRLLRKRSRWMAGSHQHRHRQHTRLPRVRPAVAPGLLRRVGHRHSSARSSTSGFAARCTRHLVRSAMRPCRSGH